MGATATLLVAVAAIIVAPLVGYLAASRKLSGKIGTSDATRLWDASETMRTETRTDLASANKRIVDLEARVAGLEAANNQLTRENHTLEQRVSQLLAAETGD